MRTLIAILSILCVPTACSSVKAAEQYPFQGTSHQSLELALDNTCSLRQEPRALERGGPLLSLRELRDQDAYIRQETQKIYRDTRRKANVALWGGGALLVCGAASFISSFLKPTPTLSADDGGYWDLDQLENYLNASPLTLGEHIIRYSGVPALASGLTLWGGAWYYKNCAKKAQQKSTPRHLCVRITEEDGVPNVQQPITQDLLHNSRSLNFLGGWTWLRGGSAYSHSSEVAELLKSPSFLHAERVYLDLSGFVDLTLQDLVALLGYSQVYYLDLRRAHLTNEHCDAFVYAKHLRILDIRENPAIGETVLNELIQYTFSGPMRHTFRGNASIFQKIAYGLTQASAATFQSLEKFYCDAQQLSFVTEDHHALLVEEEEEEEGLFDLFSRIQSLTGLRDFKVSVLDSTFEELEPILNNYRILYQFSEDTPISSMGSSIVFNPKGSFFFCQDGKMEADLVTTSEEPLQRMLESFLERCATYLRVRPPAYQERGVYEDISDYAMFYLVRNPKEECVITEEMEVALLIHCGLVASVGITLDKS